MISILWLIRKSLSYQITLLKRENNLTRSPMPMEDSMSTIIGKRQKKNSSHQLVKYSKS